MSALSRAFPRKWDDLPPSPSRSTTHALEIRSAGPWAHPPKTHVAARCTCNDWHVHWTLEELQAALEENQTFADVHWSRVEEGIRQQHLVHVAEVAEKAARRAAARPGPDFY